MRFTKPRDLLVPGLVAVVVAHLVVRLVYADIPQLPALAGAPLLVLAVVEGLFGYGLRGRIRGAVPGKPVQALTAARAVALAKASSLLGAIMAGAWLGVLLYLAPAAGSVDAARQDLVVAVTGLASAAALVGAALWLEACCRTPRDPDERPDGR